MSLELTNLMSLVDSELFCVVLFGLTLLLSVLITPSLNQTLRHTVMVRRKMAGLGVTSKVQKAYNDHLNIINLFQVSYLWEEISWLQQCLSASQSSCSCTLQTRLKMLQAVSQLQVA